MNAVYPYYTLFSIYAQAFFAFLASFVIFLNLLCLLRYVNLRHTITSLPLQAQHLVLILSFPLKD